MLSTTASRLLCSLSLFTTFAIRSSAADSNQTIDWPDWRGPHFNGHVPAESNGKKRELPLTWNEATKENIAWKTPIPGKGHCTPAIGEGRVWVTSATPDGKESWVYGLNFSDGKIFFQTKLFDNPSPEPLGNPVNTYASPSVTLEPGRVYVHFGSYGTAALDSKTGKTLWTRRDLPCRHYRGPGSSPFIYQNLLIITMDGVDQQYVTALDKATGKTVWRTNRSTPWDDIQADGTPKAEGDFRKSFNTPVVIDSISGPLLLSVASRMAFAYNPMTGEEVWKYGLREHSCSSRPLFDKERLYINTGYGKAHLVAIKFDPAAKGNISSTPILWEITRNISSRASSLLADSKIFTVDEGGIATCVESATGKELWRERLPGKFTSSPILFQNHIYSCNEGGQTYVLEVADTYKLLAKNELAEGLYSSPAVGGNRLILRTTGSVYAIGK